MVRNRFKKKVAIFIMVMLLLNFAPVIGKFGVRADSTLVGVSISDSDSIVLGKTKTISVNISNNYSSYLYNTGLEVELESGMEFVPGSENTDFAPIVTTEEVSYDIDLGKGTETVTVKKQKLIWNDIKDLAHNDGVNENFNVTFQVKSLKYKQYIDSNQIIHDLPIDFGDSLIGRVRAAASTDPQLLPMEDDWTSFKEFQMTVKPFEVVLSGGGKQLKGAGEAGIWQDANRSYQYQIKLINNEFYGTTLDLTNKIDSEIEAQNFNLPPDFESFMNNNDYYEVFWEDIRLQPAQNRNITYDAAVFNRFTTINGDINDGDIIQDNTSLNNNLFYSGYVTDLQYTGDNSIEYTNASQPIKRPTIAKDIIISKKVDGVNGSNSSRFQYDDEFIYTLTVKVNGYYDMDNVKVVDTIKDGQSYVDGSAISIPRIDNPPDDVIPVVDEEAGDGTRKITWNIGKIEFDNEWTKVLTLNTTVDEFYSDSLTPIVANDSLRNEVDVEGQGVPDYRTGDTNPIRLGTDSGSASINSGKPNISKIITNKTGSLGPNDELQVGDKITFTITYTANLGVKQKDVIISDILPLGLKFIDTDPITNKTGGWESYNYDEVINLDRNIITWTFNDYLLQDVDTLTVDVTAEVQDIPEVTIDKQDQNLAKLTFKNTKGLVNSDRDGIPITYLGCVLGINKSADKTSGLRDGQEVVFTLTVDNINGNAPAYDVVVEDTVPIEFENVTMVTDFASDTNLTNNSSGNNLSFTVGEIPAGGTIDIHYKGTVKSGIGANYSMTNSTQVKSYKKISGGAVYVNQQPSDFVTMNTNAPVITKTVHDWETKALGIPVRIGDYIVYKISVDVPAGNTAYNSNLADKLPANMNFVGIYSDYTDHNTKTDLNVDKYVLDGSNITIDTGNLSGGTYQYYIETVISNKLDEDNEAVFSYWNKSVQGEEFHISDTANQSVDIPVLNSSWSSSRVDNIMYIGEIDSYTYSIVNNGDNTAYDFIPVIKIPQQFEASNFTDKDGTEISPVSITNETIDGDVHNVYTLPKINELLSGTSYPINMNIILSNNRGSGEILHFNGYTGFYYTHDDDANINRLELGPHNDDISVRIPMADITKNVNRTEYNDSKDQIRPGDTIWYDLKVTVNKGTNVYDLKLIDILPNGFDLVSITNDTLGTSINAPDYIISDLITETTNDTVYDITIEAVANPDYSFNNPQTIPLTNKAKIIWKTKETGGQNKETPFATANINLVQPKLNIVGYGQTGTILFNDIDDVENFTIDIINNGFSTAYNSEFRIEIPDFLESADEIPDYTVITDGGKKYLQWTDKQLTSSETITLSFNLRLLSDGTAEAGKEGSLKAQIIGYNSLDIEGKSYTSSDTALLPVKVDEPSLDLYVLDSSSQESKKEIFIENDDLTLRTKITLPKGTKLYDGKMAVELSKYIDENTLNIKDGINGANKSIEENGGRYLFKFDIPSDYTINGTFEIITDIKGKTVMNSPGYSSLAGINTATLKWIDDSKSLQDTTEVGLAAIDIIKNVSPLNAVLGQEIKYTITVENRGSETLNDISVIDNLPPYIDLDGTIPALSPGAKQTFVEIYEKVVEADLQGTDSRTVTNTVYAEVDYNDNILKDFAYRDVNLLREHAMQVDKTVDIEEPLVGETITYTITVTNVSSSKNLTNVTITDSMLGLINEPIGDLDIGEFGIVSGTYLVTNTNPIHNIASAVGYSDNRRIREDGEKIVYVNTPPEVGDYYEETNEDTPVDGIVVGTDIDRDTLTYSKESNPSHGNVVVNSDGYWEYTPHTNYFGTDSFKVKVSDGKRGEAVSTIYITIKSVNDAPDVPDYIDTTPEETPVSGIVTGTDIENDDLSYSKGSDPDNGIVEVDSLGNWTYTPDKDFVGEDSFTVLVDDGNGGISESTVTITVTPVNDFPTVPDYSETTWLDTPVSGTVIGSDIDKDVLTYSVNTNPSYGNVKVNSDGTWTYTPDTGYLGEDSFTVLVDDGNGGTVISKIIIEVRRRPIRNTNNPPSAPDYLIETLKNTSVSGVVIGTDPDNDTLSYSNTSNPANGTIVMDIDGSFTYIPDKDFVGTDSFRVRINDGKGGTAFSTVTIKIIDDDNIISYEITLRADPSKILGDGKSTSNLTARVTDNFGNPVVGAEVIFTAPYGSFPQGDTAVTNTQGNASVVYQSEKIKGVNPVVSKITAKVIDKERNIYAEDDIDVTFEPAAIRGVVVNNSTGLPVKGAVVTISKDFNNDGIIDFSTEYITKEDGRYMVYIPEGHVVYDISITKPIIVDNDVVYMTFKQKSEVREITGIGGEVFDSRKTATGVMLIKNPDGSQSLLSDYSKYKVDLYDENGNLITYVNASIDYQSGIFHVENLEQNKKYNITLKRELGSNVHIIVGKVSVTLNDYGEINISQALIDPYGTITDSVTGKIITEADVKLYYADTQRNINGGITPHTLVELPIIDFPPNDNHNPQYSDEFGKYAYMVFPNTDYYIVVDKSGYYQYISPIISVYLEIVKHDIQIDPITKQEIDKDEDKIPIPKTGDNRGHLPYALFLTLISILYIYLAKKEVFEESL